MYKEYGGAIEAEEREAHLDTPILVCQLVSLPGMPTLLHFFEPRYVCLPVQQLLCYTLPDTASCSTAIPSHPTLVSHGRGTKAWLFPP
jgi:hypothetical protein